MRHNPQPSMKRNFSFVVLKYRLVDQHLKNVSNLENLSPIKYWSVCWPRHPPAHWSVHRWSLSDICSKEGCPVQGWNGTGHAVAGKAAPCAGNTVAPALNHPTSAGQQLWERVTALLGEAISPEKINFSKFDFHQTFWIDVTSAVTICLARFPFH